MFNIYTWKIKNNMRYILRRVIVKRWINICQQAHPLFSFAFVFSAYNETFSYSPLRGALPISRNLAFSLSNARFAPWFSSAFFCIYYYLSRAFLASSVNAYVTFELSFADVSMHGTDPISFTNYFAWSLDTCLCVSKSLLFPITINGNESG